LPRRERHDKQQMIQPFLSHIFKRLFLNSPDGSNPHPPPSDKLPTRARRRTAFKLGGGNRPMSYFVIFHTGMYSLFV
jgi:hypothetical protein